MRKLTFLFITLLFVVLTACTPMIYGVPQERWDLMSENERIAAMEAYKERQIAYQRAAAENARIRAEQEAVRQAQLDSEMQRRQERVDQIYRGRTGTFGDLLEVSLYDGQIRLNGKKRGYSPVTFKIADGEIKAVPIYYSKGRKADLFVLYENRHLWLDTDPYGQNTRRAGHLIYNDDWATGVTYESVNSHGSRDLRGVNIDVDVIPLKRGRGYGRHQPTVIIKEKVVQAPPTVIVKEKIVYKPQKIIIKEKVVETPQKTIEKEQPVKVDKHREEGARQQKGVGGDNKENSQLSFQELKEKRRDEREQAKQIRSDVRDEAEKSKEKDQKQKEVSKQTTLAKVMINGGKIRINGKYRPFNPVKFSISEGETKTINLTGDQKSATHKAFSSKLIVSFVDGQIYFDGQPGSAAAYKASASKGEHKVSTKGPTNMHQVDVRIDVN